MLRFLASRSPCSRGSRREEARLEQRRLVQPHLFRDAARGLPRSRSNVTLVRMEE